MPRLLSRATVTAATLGFVCASLVATATGWAYTAAQPAGHVSPTATQPDVASGLIASPIATPHPVVAADGKRHLVYELQLINAAEVAVTVDRVETVDARSGRVLAVLEGDAVAAVMRPFGGKPPGSTLQAGEAGVIMLDAALPRSAPVPRTIAHDFSLTYTSDLGLPAEQRSGVVKIARDRPVVVGAPLQGAGWVAVNACCDGATPHRQAIIPINGAFYVAQRFAIDFARLTPDRRVFDGDPEQLASWPSYGAEVVSATRGVVVGTRDGFADNVPVGSLPPISLDNVGGNYVVVDIGGGKFAFYAHLQPGSLTVSVGDRVRRGQVLGLVGNSGNSDFPHLHFHVMDSPSPLASDGLPYEFDFFSSPGSIANGDEVLAGEPAVFDTTLSGPHSHQIPMDLQVVDFRP